VSKLLLIPLEDEIVFPHMTVTLTVDTAGEERVLLVPRHENEYASVGTVAEVTERLRLPGGGRAVVVTGLHRGVLGAAEADSRGQLRVEVEERPDDEAWDARLRELGAEYRAVVEEILDFRGDDGRIAAFLRAISDPGALADTVGYSPEVDLEQKVQVLETLDLRERLQLALELQREVLARFEVRKRIREDVESGAQKQQREYILRRQLESIRKELGEDDASVIEEYRQKLEGCSHGYGGSMHLYDVERGNLGANAVVAGGLPAITGAALAFKFRNEPRVALAFFGDGATNIGTFHESLNLAQLWRVPAVFVLENNNWAESTPRWQHSPIEDFTKRAVAYGMHSLKVDGQDLEAVYMAASEAIDHARRGDGPVLLVVETYRLVGHYVGDPQVYRPKGELQELRKTQDPVTKLREKLGVSDEEWEQIDREVTQEVEESVEFAKNGTDPAPEDALKNIYA
jgi:TPP-dependent pyruvate/acetoin dehydrogenase alpha subunit